MFRSSAWCWQRREEAPAPTRLAVCLFQIVIMGRRLLAGTKGVSVRRPARSWSQDCQPRCQLSGAECSKSRGLTSLSMFPIKCVYKLCVFTGRIQWTVNGVEVVCARVCVCVGVLAKVLCHCCPAVVCYNIKPAWIGAENAHRCVSKGAANRRRGALFRGGVPRVA